MVNFLVRDQRAGPIGKSAMESGCGGVGERVRRKGRMDAGKTRGYLYFFFPPLEMKPVASIYA